MIAAALALAFQPATMPQAPPAPPPPRLAPAPRGAAALKALGMSDAGIRVIQTVGAPDPDTKAFGDRRAALRARLDAAADAQPFDPAVFLAAMKDENGADTEARGRKLDTITRTMQALAPSDRQIFARVVIGRRDPLPPPGVVPPPAPVPPK